MNITNDFDVKCTTCLDTGEYYNGTKMVKCKCKSAKNENRDTRETVKVSKSDS